MMKTKEGKKNIGLDKEESQHSTKRKRGKKEGMRENYAFCFFIVVVIHSRPSYRPSPDLALEPCTYQ